MIVFHHQLAHLKELNVPKEVADWVLAQNERYPDVTFMIGFINKNAKQRQEAKATVEQYSHGFIGGSVPGVSQVVFYYHGETWNVRIIGNLTLDERNEIAELPPLSELFLAKANTYLLKRSPDQPPAERASEHIVLRSERNG